MTRALFLLLAATLLSGCPPARSVLVTAEGNIPRKVVVRADSTPLFTSRSLGRIEEYASQWSVYFITGEYKDSFRVSHTINAADQPVRFLRRADAVEWNTFFCLAYANSPARVGRRRVVTFASVEQARNASGDTVLIEKPKHRASRDSPQPILREHTDRIYHVVSLYDNVDSAGNYVFLGNYAFGYVKHQSDAHVLLRYVSRSQLQQDIQLLLGSQYRTKDKMNPTELDGFWGPLRGLLATFEDGTKSGVNDLISVFRDSSVPSHTQSGLLDPSNLANPVLVRSDLSTATLRMIELEQDSSIWNPSGHAFVPIEWLPEPRR